MPELPEVDRAANLVKTHALSKKIIQVETTEDNIVFSGVSSTEFAKEIQGRTVKDVRRYGKVFFLELDGEGRMPVLHFGMTGNILVKGEEPLYYKEGPKRGNSDWPPRFSKFIIHLLDTEESTVPDTQIAFVDARRLGRIRLCGEPLKEPPISSLGFDPLLCMPPLADFSRDVLRRTCPIKALLLNQSFSAGVGNWVADEILYHAHIHPEQRCNTLNAGKVSALHQKMTYVCQMAVSVDADSSKFPESWLFNHRWGKGKKKKKSAVLRLPSGEPATIRWTTVGGRTSAYVVEVQTLRSAKRASRGIEPEVIQENEDSDLTTLSDLEEKTARTRSETKVQANGRKRQKTS